MRRRYHSAPADITERFPDRQRAADDLTRFAKTNDKRLYQLLRTLMNPETELKALLKAEAELRKKIADKPIGETFEIFVHRSAFLILGRASVPTLLKHVEEPYAIGHVGATAAAELAKELLVVMAKGSPLMFRPLVVDLAQTLSTESSSEDALEVALLAVSELAKVSPTCLPPDS